MELLLNPAFWIGVLVCGTAVLVAYIVVRLAVRDELDAREYNRNGRR